MLALPSTCRLSRSTSEISCGLKPLVATSALVTPAELQALVSGAGFTIAAYQDTTLEARAWFAALADKVKRDGPPPISWSLLMGADFPVMAQNQRRNLEEDRIALIQLVAVK